MPSLSIERPEIAVVTLSFGGVDFCLIPSCTGDIADTFSISKICNVTDEVEIDLNNFVGTLRVKNHDKPKIAPGDVSSSLAPTKRVNNPAVSGEKRALDDDDDEDYTPPDDNDDDNDDDDITLEQLAKKKRPPTIEPLAKKKRVNAECSDDDKIKNTVEEQQDRVTIGLDRTSPSSTTTSSKKEEIAKIHNTIFFPHLELELVQPNLPENAEKHLNELIKFHKLHGHCNVPDSRNKNTPLGKWVKDIRWAYRIHRNRRLKNGNHGEHKHIFGSTELSPDLIERLNAMGFEWSIAFKEDVWMSKFEMLKEYVAKNGPCLPPRKHEIGHWVRDQRYHGYRRLRGEHAKITDARMRKLHDLGFKWDVSKIRKDVSKIREKDAGKGREGTPSSGAAPALVPLSAGEGGTDSAVEACPAGEGGTDSAVEACPAGERGTDSAVEACPAGEGGTHSAVVACPAGEGGSQVSVLDCTKSALWI